jgi:hypothetical protein
MAVKTFEQIYGWLELAKGGAGSGPPVGHTFRGNRYTSGVGAGRTHDIRPGTENFRYSQNLDSAKAHVISAQTAVRNADFGEAYRQLNEGAYHSSQAAMKLQEPGGYTNRSLGNEAKGNYVLFHHTANLCEIANKAIHDYASALKGAQSQEEIESARSVAENSRLVAEESMKSCMQHLVTVDRIRIATKDPAFSTTTFTAPSTIQGAPVVA